MRQILLFTLLAFAATVATAQQTAGESTDPRARLVGDPVTEPSGCSAFDAGLHELAVGLESDLTASGYVIIYQPGGDTRALRLRETLAKSTIARKVRDRSRVTVVRGPAKIDARTELWIVPMGAEPPETQPADPGADELLPGEPEGLPAHIPDKAYRFYEYQFDSRGFCEFGTFTNAQLFARRLSAHPGSRGNIVIRAKNQAAFRELRDEIRQEIADEIEDGELPQLTIRYIHQLARKPSDTDVELWVLPPHKRSADTTSNGGQQMGGDVSYVKLMELLPKIERISKEISSGSDSWDARVERAKLYVETSQPRLAEADLSAAISMAGHPYEVAKATLDRGSVRERLGNAQEAITDYAAVISLAGAKPYWGQGYLRRGRVMQAKGRFSDALADADAAVSFYSTNRSSMRKQLGEAFALRSYINCDAGKTRAAAADAARAKTLGTAMKPCRSK